MPLIMKINTFTVELSDHWTSKEELKDLGQDAIKNNIFEEDPYSFIEEIREKMLQSMDLFWLEPSQLVRVPDERKGKYWICDDCAKLKGWSVLTSVVTVIKGLCGHCDREDEVFLTPVVDYSRPGKRDQAPFD